MLFAYDIFHSIKLYYDINLLKLPDMFHKNLLLPLLLAFSIQANSQSHTKFVDPYIGSAAHGHNLAVLRDDLAPYLARRHRP